MVRKIRSGQVEEMVKFRVGANTKLRSGRKKGTTTARKQDANERDCIKRLARIINCNFGHGDYLQTHTYDDAGMKKLLSKVKNADDMDEIREVAEHEFDLYIDRLKRRFKKEGFELKRIALTSDIDGDTGECVRIHHHLIVNGDAFSLKDKKLYVGDKALNDIWGNGVVDYQPLRNQADYTPLAIYLIKQVRRQPDAKKYKPSRNLDKPVLVSEILVHDPSELSAPKGATLLHRNEYDPGMPQYIRYIPAPKKQRKITKPVKTVRRSRTKYGEI